MKGRFLAIEAADACVGCHVNLNPFGLSMETFDAVGRFRTKYHNGEPVDAVVESKSGRIPKKTYNGAAEILDATAMSPVHWQCLVKQAFSHATGLKPVGYDPLLREAYVAFVKSDLNLRQLFVTILASDVLQSRGGGK